MSTTAPTRTPVSGTATAVRRRKPFLLDLYDTAVGKKYAMAISGIALMGFVLFHMIGNLKMYLGEADLNEYAAFLKKLLYPNQKSTRLNSSHVSESRMPSSA